MSKEQILNLFAVSFTIGLKLLCGMVRFEEYS